MIRARTFTPDELAFFATPRTWPEITVRFLGSTRRSGSSRHMRVTEAVILADSDGGSGWLDWDAPSKTWGLTRRGRAFIAREALADLAW